MDGEAQQITVHGVAKSWTRLSDFTFTFTFPSLMGFPGGTSGEEPACQCRRQKKCEYKCGFNPWARQIPWRGAQQSTPVFLLGESQRKRNLAGYSLRGHKELDMTECVTLSHFFLYSVFVYISFMTIVYQFLSHSSRSTPNSDSNFESLRRIKNALRA